jgi:hypothetical protein
MIVEIIGLVLGLRRFGLKLRRSGLGLDDLQTPGPS